jgi:(E)-4-hydroxy-3-methylbut-2-enyl-diphosphate synthase
MKKTVNIGGVRIGGGHEVAIQSMTNTPTVDIAATIAQINALAAAGAKLVRISVPNEQSVQAIPEILSGVSVPLIGDFHYGAKLAVEGIKKGLGKIRINPGNMSKSAVEDIVKCAKDYNIPIRVGVNKGSIKDRDVTPQRLAALTLDTAKLIEDMGYDNLVLAVKSSDVADTVRAYKELDKLCDYPLHVGLTEAGYGQAAAIKSAVAIGSLLLDGIGDTIRVSLAGNPVKEIEVAKSILRAAGKDKKYADIIACPTCARCHIDIEKLASQIDQLADNASIPLKIAVMGCTVNGIGEGKDADFGVAAGKEKSVIFLKGEEYKTVDNKDILAEMEKILEKFINEKD